MFAAGSRYQGLPEGTHVDREGRPIVYVLLRPIPSPPPDREQEVQQGDRLDLLAAAAYDDPEQYWRICDANRAFDPDDLVPQPGRRLTIPLQVR